MSLFLGNLSSNVRREELERVFWRFGRSSVQLKDGYGFVKFDVPSNAEKALRSLRGKNICGEPISVTWANKQPRPSQRFARGKRSDGPYHPKNLTRGESYGTRKKGFFRLPDYKMNAEHPNSSNGRFSYMTDQLDEETSHHEEQIGDHGGEKDHNSNEGLLDGGGSGAADGVDIDRWGEHVGKMLNTNVVEDGTDMDRYEPYHGFDRRDQEENQNINGSLHDNNWREHTGEGTLKQPDYTKPQPTCYGCGLTGHIMRNCPRADTSQRKRFTHFDHRRDERIGFTGNGDRESKRLRRSSWGRSKSSKDPMSKEQQRTDRREHGSRKSSKLVRRNGSFPVNKRTTLSLVQRDDKGKRKSRAEYESPKEHHGKKSRKLDSSPMRSNSTASSLPSHLRSSKFVSGISFRSRSRSVSSKSRSVSSTSASSASSYSRSESSSSRSTSKSSSPSSLSLSSSPGLSLPSPSKVTTKASTVSLKGHLENAHSPQSKEPLIEEKQILEIDAGVTFKDENVLPSLKVDGESKKVSHRPLGDDGNPTTSKVGYEVTDPGTATLEERTSPFDSSSLENSVDKRGPWKSQSLELIDSPNRKLNLEVPTNSQIDSSTKISSEEMYMVLKGLPLAEDSEKNLPPEVFFGSARLWPWEIIYYRRLKKGLISMENYARRLSQNREFGIVDKYVRSSSGWHESDNTNS